MSKGRALHIGLNHIDPAHYGTDGELAGCINDANDMLKMAQALGYAAQPPIVDGDATVARVKSEINAAAADLQAGDSFLITYAGHGGQVPDASGDEVDDPLGGKGDDQDETWCLFDRELVDDELYSLYAGFLPGVRITVVSDSCHSGTVTRAVSLGGRFLGREVLKRVYSANKELYDGIQREYPASDRVTVGASIILISGCMDNQTSADGQGNGRFTEELKKVWDNGAFQGSLGQLRERITAGMPPDQTPNYFVAGAPNRDFERAQAFSI